MWAEILLYNPTAKIFFFFFNNNNTANISEIHKIFMVGLSWVWINKFIQ